MKITLISPKGPLYRHRSGIFKQSLRYAPLTLTTLASLIPPELNAEVEIIDEGIEEIDPNLETDLIGMTVITGTSIRAYQLAAQFRQRNIPVILGGPHVTLMPDEAAQHADAIVVGYAEESWPQLLQDFTNNTLQPRYAQNPNLSLTNLPFPRRDLLPAFRYSTKHTFEATRACVHRCEFCVVPAAWGTTPLQKPIGDVLADIQQMKSTKLIFLDLNLIANRTYAAELFTALIPLNVSWFGLATVLLAFDAELLELAARSGCRGLLVGFESLSAKTLHASKKGFNNPARYLEAIQSFHAHKISLMGCFVFGMDEDQETVFEETAAFVHQAKIDLPRFAILTPFPGTPLFSRLKKEGRILTENWELYDGQHVVFQPTHMSASKLQKGTEYAWKKSYSWQSIWHRIGFTPRQPLISLSANLGYRFYAHNLDRFYHCDVQI